MWKPIVTAPKDGSFVLICDTEDPSELMIIARWRFGAWRSKPTPSGKSIVWMDATHWMPLPEMPNADLATPHVAQSARCLSDSL